MVSLNLLNGSITLNFINFCTWCYSWNELIPNSFSCFVVLELYLLISNQHVAWCSLVQSRLSAWVKLDFLCYGTTWQSSKSDWLPVWETVFSSNMNFIVIQWIKVVCLWPSSLEHQMLVQQRWLMITKTDLKV